MSRAKRYGGPVALFGTITILSASSWFLYRQFPSKGKLCRPPRGYQIHTLSLPEKADDDTNLHVRLAYYMSPHFNSESDAVVYVNGGPGVASSGQGERILQSVYNSPAYHQFIFFDQRGTGCSSPYPDSVSALQSWGARAIARDTAFLLDKLRIDPRRTLIWGHSYGAVVVGHYVLHHLRGPERLFATGYVPPRDMSSWLENRQKQQESFYAKMFDPAYSEILAKIRDRLRNTCIEGGDQKICGQTIADGLYRVAADSTLLARILYAAMRGDLAPFTNAVRGAMVTRAQEALGYIDYTPGRTFGDLCRDYFSARRGADHVGASLLECRFDASTTWTADLADIFQLTPDPIDWNVVDQVLRKKENPGLRFVIGTDDYFAPIESARVAADAGFGKIRFAIVPGTHFDYTLQHYQ